MPRGAIIKAKKPRCQYIAARSFVEFPVARSIVEPHASRVSVKFRKHQQELW